MLNRLAYGTDTGAVVVDIVHKVCLLNVASPDLYGGADPYQRVPKSPKRTQPPDTDSDRCRSPSIDQVRYVFIINLISFLTIIMLIRLDDCYFIKRFSLRQTDSLSLGCYLLDLLIL